VRGYVLAGGASSRFGSDKALAKIGQESVLERVCRLLDEATGEVRVIAPDGRYPDFQGKLVSDRWPGQGPLGGIITALLLTAESGASEWNLILSCDMPFLTGEWLSYLAGRALRSTAEVVVPESRHGWEPLCACWRTAGASELALAFDQGVRKVTEAMRRLPVEVLDERDWKRFDSAERLFWNMNTYQDYQQALRLWGKET
jgi:molybdenum cofactor guanylyltransferase